MGLALGLTLPVKVTEAVVVGVLLALPVTVGVKVAVTVLDVVTLFVVLVLGLGVLLELVVTLLDADTEPVCDTVVDPEEDTDTVVETVLVVEAVGDTEGETDVLGLTDRVTVVDCVTVSVQEVEEVTDRLVDGVGVTLGVGLAVFIPYTLKSFEPTYTVPSGPIDAGLTTEPVAKNSHTNAPVMPFRPTTLASTHPMYTSPFHPIAGVL